MKKFQIFIIVFLILGGLVWYFFNARTILIGYYGDNVIIDNGYYIPGYPESKLYQQYNEKDVNKINDYDYRFSNLQKTDKKLSEILGEKINDNYGKYESLSKLILLRSERNVLLTKDQAELNKSLQEEIIKAENIYGEYFKGVIEEDGTGYYIWNKNYSSLILKINKDNTNTYHLTYLLLDDRLHYFNLQMSPESLMSVCENTKGCKNFYGKTFLIK